ncbi:MAG: histidine phosphatase family protein [Pseudomonadales bacterium]
MKLYILRHGTAERWLNDSMDFDRQLTDFGVAQIEQLVPQWRTTMASIETWVSPYQRTQQTAKVLLGAEASFQTTRLITPEASLVSLLNLLPEQKQDLLLVSHQPLVSSLVAKLSGLSPYDCPMSPASLAVLEGDVMAASCMDLRSLNHSV